MSVNKWSDSFEQKAQLNKYNNDGKKNDSLVANEKTITYINTQNIMPRF